MKKMLRVFGIFAVVICLILSIVACDNNGDKDSIDVVAISESEYASVEDALKGYVKEELAYSASYDNETLEIVKAEYVSNESKGEVAGDKIKLSNEQKTNFVSAEKFAVKVKVAVAPNDGEEAKFSESTQTVYVLKYGEKYKFMVSTPEVGERATNSYFKMITDASKYENCTVNQAYKEFEDDEESDFEGSEYKFTTEALYRARYYDKTRYDNRTPGKGEDSSDRQTYVVNNGDNIATVYNHYDGDKELWTVITNNYENIKTVKAYNKEVIEEMLSIDSAAMFIATANGLEYKVEQDDNVIVYRIIVTEDKITGTYMNSKYSWTDDEDGKTHVKVYEADVKITAFGSTTVSVPTEVTEALSQLA